MFCENDIWKHSNENILMSQLVQTSATYICIMLEIEYNPV